MPRRLPIQRSCLAVAMAVLLAACAPRGELTFDPDAAGVGSVQTLIVATDRRAGTGLPLYTRWRDETRHFMRFQISVPPDRDLGTVTYPKQTPPDPRTDFLTVAAWRLNGEAAFVGAVNERLAHPSTKTGEVMMFIPGYNTSFAEGLYRHAQLMHDLNLDSAHVHFSWPSAAAAQGYAYDRESALYSRDALEQTIAALNRSRADRINLVAHSMGTFLLMDTLRLMARVDEGRSLSRVNAVVLLSPDIEIDVFRRQVQPLVARGVPVIVIVSSRDRALRFSALIRGESTRLGSVHPEDLKIEGVSVLDISSVKTPDSLGHFAVATSPALIEFLRTIGDSGLDVFEHPRGPLEIGASIIQEGTDLILEPLTP